MMIFYLPFSEITLNGRSVRLDVHAIEDNGTEVDIEIQRDDRGAGFKRARLNSSLLDASILKPKQKGVEVMCRVMEEMRNETELATRIDNALEMINDGQLSLEKIAQYSGLSLEKVRELAEKRSA